MNVEMLNLREGFWTLQNVETGDHRTFRVSVKRRGALKDKMIVSLMTGTDNERHYTVFAFMGDNGKIFVWKRLRGNGKVSVYDAYAYMLSVALDAVVDGSETVKIKGRTYRMILADYCRRCGRMLTNPESCDLHIGPECRKHYDM